ncbi:MAG: dethiobiotin synthase [Selenomonas sp.]|uniref:dethiobiotin synthase n=1 Tax=Selenomonas sp. TaxID=2053611 RepID=UPI0025D5E660|nr:dethiobiotin synthase [Selenomonas sp.]MCR5439659.1 dethiobiotin synthase [Selenomonas sp.]
MGKALFITGTGTDIGKTYVTALIVKKLRDAGLNGGYYKAALSGAVRDEGGELQPGDALYVKKVAGIGEEASNLVSYIYEEAVSPHLAAKINREPINFGRVEADYRRAKEKYEYLTMEGSGGIICPLRWDESQHMVLDDLVKHLNLGVLIVADAGLGTINSAVLTIEHLRARGIPIRGIVFNNYLPQDIMQEDNARMIEEMTGVKVLAYVKKGDRDLDIRVEVLKGLYE